MLEIFQFVLYVNEMCDVSWLQQHVNHWVLSYRLFNKLTSLAFPGATWFNKLGLMD